MYVSRPAQRKFDGRRRGEQYVSKLVDRKVMNVCRSAVGNLVRRRGRDVDPERRFEDDVVSASKAAL
jgi:hypothetical protein